MNLLAFWQRYGTFIAVNFVLVSIIVDLIIRGNWRASGLASLILVVGDLFVGRILRRKSSSSGHAHSPIKRWGFFRFYGYLLLAGGLTQLASGIRKGITWFDVASCVVLLLLAIAMLSIGRRMDPGS
jgi:hypothetical protein